MRGWTNDGSASRRGGALRGPPRVARAPELLRRRPAARRRRRRHRRGGGLHGGRVGPRGRHRRAGADRRLPAPPVHALPDHQPAPAHQPRLRRAQGAGGALGARAERQLRPGLHRPHLQRRHRRLRHGGDRRRRVPLRVGRRSRAGRTRGPHGDGRRGAVAWRRMLTTFAGATLDRAAERRTDAAWVAERLADAESRAVVVIPGGALLEGDRLARVPLDGLDGEPLLLGLEDGHALFAVDTASPGAVGLRDAAARLSQSEGGLAAYASALANWHRSHRHCARCGTATEVAEAGFVRRCPACGAHHHPRTDPVVIMLVIDRDGDRVLLGRQPTWPPGRYSALAGFVEPGESLEEAVAREVLEEAGVEIGEPRYVASQPWPFPSSLMLGFMADHAAGDPGARDGGLDDARGVTRP